MLSLVRSESENRLFRLSQSFTFGRGLKTVRVIFKCVLHFSGNRELNLFTGLCFLEPCYFHFIFSSFSQSFKYLLSTYYMASTILVSEDTVVNKRYQ